MEPGARPDDADPDHGVVHADDLHGRHRRARIAAQRRHRRGRRGRLAAVGAHRLGLLPSALHAPGDGDAGAGRRRHGRRPLHLRAEHPARLPARRAGRPAGADPAQCGRHPHEPGLHRQQLHPADRRRRDQRVRAPLPRQRRAAGGPGGAHALQPQPDPGLVRRADGDHQQRHHAVHHPDRRRADPRARARHHRTPACHAGDTDGDHGRQSVVDGAGRTGVGRAIVDVHRARAAASADRRVRRPVPGRRGPAPVRHHLDGHLHGHAGAQHAAIRHAAGAGAAALADAVGRHHAARACPSSCRTSCWPRPPRISWS